MIKKKIKICMCFGLRLAKFILVKNERILFLAAATAV